MKPDPYQLVTDRIVAKLEKSTVPWKHFANSPSASPKNLASKKACRGINYCLRSEGKYCSQYWVTYKQAQDLGGHVRKGEKSELVVFWKFLSVEDKDARPGEISSKSCGIPFLRHYSVFNVEQCEGIDYAKLAEQAPRESDPLDQAEAIVAG